MLKKARTVGPAEYRPYSVKRASYTEGGKRRGPGPSQKGGGEYSNVPARGPSGVPRDNGLRGALNPSSGKGKPDHISLVRISPLGAIDVKRTKHQPPREAGHPGLTKGPSEKEKDILSSCATRGRKGIWGPSQQQTQ